LIYKSHLEEERAVLTSQYERAKESSEKMRQLLKKLSDDINASEDKLIELKQKLVVAKQQEKMNELNQKFANDPLSNVGSLLDAVQKRVDAADAAAALNKELNKEACEAADLAKKYDVTTQEAKIDKVEEQLAMLKAGMEKQP
jgi:phage shock protein A